MTPTAKLRFINRKVPATMSDERGHTYTIKVLQQWWIDENHLTPAEWRDVPLEME
jgi:hypothetical protein